MHMLSKRTVAFAFCLSALAGYVDAVGFLELDRTFVSFMSGNSTQLSVALIQGSQSRALLLAEVIAFFVIGAALGTAAAKKASPLYQTTAVLLLVTALLMTAAFFHTAGRRVAAVLLMTLAMGAENAALQRADDIVIGVTYMTGTLVKIGQRLAHAFMGGGWFSWLPYLLLWLGLISGGVSGALAFHFLSLHSLWPAAIWAMVLTGISRIRKNGAGSPSNAAGKTL